jgi:hypothetical protein
MSSITRESRRLARRDPELSALPGVVRRHTLRDRRPYAAASASRMASGGWCFEGHTWPPSPAQTPSHH